MEQYLFASIVIIYISFCRSRGNGTHNKQTMHTVHKIGGFARTKVQNDGRSRPVYSIQRFVGDIQHAEAGASWLRYIHDNGSSSCIYVVAVQGTGRQLGVVRVSSRYIIIQVGGTYRTGPYPAPTYVTIISLVYHEPFSLHGRLIKCAILVFFSSFFIVYHYVREKTCGVVLYARMVTLM